MAKSMRLVIVGDVHDDWDPVIDAKALEFLKPDLVLFTGDFGDENVRLVSHVSSLDLPKAAILGNHDCWWSAGFFAKETPSNPDHENPVQAQLDLLGKSHVGYSRADFPDLRLSVVGGRPGSGGGNHIGSSSLAKKVWNIRNMKQSTERIIAQALEAPADNFLVFLAHNGPTGLGSRSNDICGKDWIPEGGDHGDPDLAMALTHVKVEGKRKVPLIVFGHMHKGLQFDMGDRNMIVVGEDKSVYLNAAVVPRIRSVKAPVGGTGLDVSLQSRSVLEKFESSSWLGEARAQVTLAGPSERNFTLVDMIDGEPRKISEVWIRVGDSDACIGEQTLLYSSS